MKPFLITLGAVFLLSLIILGIVTGERPAPQERFPHGTRARLILGTADRIPVYLTEADFLESLRASRRNDETALATLILDHRMFWTPTGSHVYVLGHGKPGSREVMLLDGRRGWVGEAAIQPLP